MTEIGTLHGETRAYRFACDVAALCAVEAMLAMSGPKESGGPFDFPGLGVYAGARGRTAPTSLPSAKIVEMEGVGHFLMLEKAEEFATLAGAVSDCRLVVGTTSVGHRELQHPLRRLEYGARLILRVLPAAPVALVFGSYT